MKFQIQSFFKPEKSPRIVKPATFHSFVIAFRKIGSKQNIVLGSSHNNLNQITNKVATEATIQFGPLSSS